MLLGGKADVIVLSPTISFATTKISAAEYKSLMFNYLLFK